LRYQDFTFAADSETMDAKPADSPGSPRAPSIPPDEGERLLALCNLGILDTEAEESYDRITRRAAAALDVPIALVSLVDDTRQWFKSRVGLDVTQTAREISFCAHAVNDRRPLVVEDAMRDPRFATNALVEGAPNIRAYLGIPLFTLSGQPVGTLCAIDTRVRQFRDEEVAALTDFAGMVEELLHAREHLRICDAAMQVAIERERLYRETFQLSATGIAHTSSTGQIIRVNPRMCQLFGYGPAELVGRSLVDLTHADDVAVNMGIFSRMISGQTESNRMDQRFLRKDGTTLWASLAVATRRDGGGQADTVIVTLEDISERKRTELEQQEARAALERQCAAQSQLLEERGAAIRQTVARMLEAEGAQQLAESRARSMADCVPAMIGYFNRDLVCVHANRAYREWFLPGPEPIVGMPKRQLLGEKLFRLDEPHAREALVGKPQRFERRLTRADGTAAHMEVRYIPDKDFAGEVRGFHVQITDVTELRVAQQELEATNAKLSREAVTDYLTGLANRRVFTARSERAAERFRDSGDAYALILIDLDDFKRINDTYGHDTGDDVLRAMGRILREELRGRDDMAARLGGEEFAVLCCGEFTGDSLLRLAERIRSRITKESVASAKGPVPFTGSLGIAKCSRDDIGWKCIYGRADAALYRSKAEGKNRVSYEPANGKLREDAAAERTERQLQLPHF
jgi:diguanylate cyclase (GGDEF)-like protein/PAS domain S-box-containing protein